MANPLHHGKPSSTIFSLACAEALEESSQVLTQSVSDAGWDEAFV